MDNRCIAFCDSGIGGLPLLRRVSEVFPNENFIYFADSSNMPYGDKTEKELAEISDSVVKKLLNFSPKLIVTACNTLSTYMYEHKKYYGVPIIGVFPATSEGKGCILCTLNTAKSRYIDNLKSCGVKVLPQAGLAEEIELALTEGRKPNADKWFDSIGAYYDYISLGCTHYEFLIKKYEQMFENAKIISGSAIAERKIKDFVARFPSGECEGRICFLGKKRDKIKDIFYNF